jgi:hypothetical protein
VNLQNKILIRFLIIISLTINSKDLIADDFNSAKIIICETSGLSRPLEYIEFQLQVELAGNNSNEINIVAEDMQNGEQIPCQVFNKNVYEKENIILLHIVFPISIEANARKIYLLKRVKKKKSVSSDLNIYGEGLNLIVENKYYNADLSKSDQSEAKSHDSGQLRELLIKMNFNQLLFRTENRMHWAPNFQKPEMEFYNTIAGWESPEVFLLNHGPYLIFSQRKDSAPDHPEILLTANYYFYAGLPYFKFFSSMNIIKNVTLYLLRNDEMTMDSLFTHIAYQDNSGQIIDLSFSERYQELEENPIDNNSPWLCFYNEKKGYAFGSIRIKYDNTNQSGLPSPTYLPHTKISDGAEGGKYWNRRLIHEYPVFVPKGSCYIEENAYIVFKINKENKFKEIRDWTARMRCPLKVNVYPEIVVN